MATQDQILYNLQQQLTAAVAAVNAARARLARTTDPEIRAEIEQFIQDELAFIARLQVEISARARISTGDTVKEDQAARTSGSSGTNPPPPAQVLENGRVVPDVDRPASNAQRPRPGATDLGTNAPVRRSTVTQSTPPGSAGSGPTAAQQAGAAAPGDDNSAGSGVRARLNALFGGVSNEIKAEDNILDQYASYTYNISVYLMSPSDYRRLVTSKQKTVAGFQLLFMSGGAGPAGSTAPGAQVNNSDPALVIQERVASLGRNEFFSLDYYIDDVQLKSYLSGKGTGSAHNVTEIKFKVIEPYSINFLDNLFAATQQYIQVAGADAAVNKNYAAQNFLMVIRFYGYDDQGNLVTVGRTGQDAAGSDVNAVVEKFIPFQFTSIKFRIANKVVEYDCSAVCPQNNVNTGASRGVIPYNIELQSQTLKDLLTGTPRFAANTGEGRATAASNQTAPGAREPANAGTAGPADGSVILGP